MSRSPLLAQLHALSSHHRAVVETSRCSCFYCLARFEGSEVKQWVDGGQTAVCPRCFIDAVLPEAGLPVPLSEEVLAEMNTAYFASSHSLVGAEP